MNGSPNDQILDAISSGRAVLLGGQGLSAVSNAQLLSSCDIASTSPDLSRLRSCLIDPVRGENAAAHVEALGQREIPPALHQIFSAPWALVVSAAIDPSIGRAIVNTYREARRLRHHFVDQPTPGVLQKRPHLLDIVHLLRMHDPHKALGQTPFGRRLRQIFQLSQPALLNGLSAQIGPAHFVCVAGFGARDLIEWQLVASSLANMDPERIVWFLTSDDQITSEELLAELPGITIVRDSHFPTSCGSQTQYRGKKRDFTGLTNQVLDRQDLEISVRVDGTSRPIVFRASELRDFRRHLEILPNMKARPLTVDLSERRETFIAFLRNPRVTSGL